MGGYGALKRMAAAVGLAVAVAATPASAVTVMVDGGTYELLSDNAFTFDISLDSSGPQDFGFEFSVDSADAPQPASVVNLTITGINGSVTNPSLVWADSDLAYSAPGYSGPGILEEATFNVFPGGISAVFSTVFDTGKLVQWLNFGYEAFDGAVIQISMQVQPVPVPPALLLFGSGLIGVGLLARRRRRRETNSA